MTVETRIEEDARWDRLSNSGDERSRFDRVENKRSGRPDVHAFIMLDEWCEASDAPMISIIDYEIVTLSIPHGDLRRLTDEQVVELIRCGVSCMYGRLEIIL